MSSVERDRQAPPLTLVPRRPRVVRDWSAEDDDLLRAGYARDSLADLTRRLGRTRSAIYQRASTLGLHRPPTHRPWTAEDDAWLTELHGVLPQVPLAVQLGRTRAAVMMRVQRLGLIRDASAVNRYQRDRDEITQLRGEVQRLQDRPPLEPAYAPSDDARRLAVLIAWRLLVISAAQAAVVLGVPVERLPVELGKAAARGLDVVTQVIEGTP